MKNSKTEIVEDYPVSWDIDEFKNLKTFGEIIKYCEENLTRISSGSARIVYKIDDEKVLKLAKNKKGIAQNEVEIGYSNDYYARNIVAETFEYDDDYLWLEMQLAKKLDRATFKRITNLDFNSYVYGIIFYSGKENNHQSETLKYLLENDFFLTVIDFINTFELPCGDFTKLNSYGLVNKDGKESIVLIDYGLTDKVFDDFYWQK